MRTLKTVMVFAIAATLTGCEGENLFANSDVILVDQPPAFEAVMFELENRAGDRIDLIDGGGRFELSLDEDAGEFDSRFQFRGSTIRRSGTFEVVNDRITFSDDPLEDDERDVARSFDFARTGDVLHLEDAATLFDVDNDGTDEVATLRIRMERRG